MPEIDRYLDKMYHLRITLPAVAPVELRQLCEMHLNQKVRVGRRRPPLRDAAGATLAELVFDSMATGYWTRLVGDTTVMRVDANRVNRLTPADSTLRVEN